MKYSKCDEMLLSWGYRGLWLPTLWQFLSLSLVIPATCFPLMKPAAIWERPTWRGPDGNICSAASEELRHSEQSGKELNPASNQVIEIGSRFFLNWAFRWDHRPRKQLHCNFVLDPIFQYWAQLSPSQIAQKVKDNKWMLFEASKYWGDFYTVIDS